MKPGGAARLERSCGPGRGDWIRTAAGGPGVERIEAFFEGYAYAPHRHDTYAIGFTMAGVQTFRYRGAQAASTAGRVIVLHPDEVHDGEAGSSDGFRYRMIYIPPRMITDALDGTLPHLPFVRDAVVDDPRLLAALRLGLGDLDHPLDPLALDEVTLGIAEGLAAHDRAGRTRLVGRVDQNAVTRVRRFLDSEPGHAVSSEDLEAVADMDRFTLARHFRRMLGTSPYRYLTMRRLDRARDLLRAGTGLAETAAEAGFADQSHMTRQFKSAFGLPPGRWLAMQRSG